MATLLEIHNAHGAPETQDLRKKILSAIAIKGHAITLETTPSAGRLDVAKQALDSPNQFLEGILSYLLAENEEFTIEQIQNAPDNKIKDEVSQAFDVLYAGT